MGFANRTGCMKVHYFPQPLLATPSYLEFIIKKINKSSTKFNCYFFRLV